MDELLSLFDNDGPTNDAAEDEPSRATNSSEKSSAATTDYNDDFTSSFGNTPSLSPHAKPVKSVTPPKSTQIPRPQTSANTPYDPITNLRITNRHTSTSTMLDAFSTLNYKSTSLLVGMNKSDWSSHVVKPSNNNSNGPSGKTNLATCGVITNEVGSRLSKSGRGFAMLQLGDLSNNKYGLGGVASGSAIHASVTVFLFGDALRILNANTKRYLGRGYAVGVLAPNLMPKSDQNNSSASSTSVSLSVTDPKQILLIGKCVDCDRCKGTTRKRSMGEFGYKFEEVRCGTLVDLRCGGYCSTHKRQGLVSCGNNDSGSGGAGKGKSNNLTFMQKQRIESSHNASNVKNLGKRKDSGVTINTGAHNGMTASSRVSEALSQAGLIHNPYDKLQSSLFNTQSNETQQMLKRAPLHMKKSTTKQEIWSNTNTPLSNINTERRTNQYRATKHTSTAPKKSANDILEAALQRKRQKTASLSTLAKSKPVLPNKRPLKIFHTEGYDGAVQVPKPNAILFKNPSLNSRANETTHSVSRGLTDNEAQAILDRQKNFAELRKELKDRPANHSTIATSKLQKTTNDPFASIFGQQPLDGTSILSAKSQFATAANAEEYARARSVVQQLEVKEGQLDQRNERKKKASQDSAIVTTGWYCKHCKIKSMNEPYKCRRLKHDVRQQRELKEKKSTVGTRKERMERHGKESEEGGLTLGSGVEWSWRGGLS